MRGSDECLARKRHLQELRMEQGFDTQKTFQKMFFRGALGCYPVLQATPPSAATPPNEMAEAGVLSEGFFCCVARFELRLRPHRNGLGMCGRLVLRRAWATMNDDVPSTCMALGPRFLSA